MQFSPLITISDIINIIISLCTIITIMLTYLTLREMKKQRNLNIMPNMVLDFTKQLNYYFDDAYNNVGKLNFKMKNVGNGLAKNIEVNINLGDAKRYSSDSIMINDKFIRLNFSKINMLYLYDNYFTYQGLQTNDEVEVQLKNIDMLLFGKCIDLFENYNDKIHDSDVMNLISEHTVNFDIFIKYTDLANNIYKTVFKIKVNPTAISFSEKKVYYSIEIIGYE